MTHRDIGVIEADHDLCPHCRLPMADWRGKGLECMSCLTDEAMRREDPLLRVEIPWWVGEP